ncbi:MAG: GGDEF domain-containing protein, partial [Oscillospiraceae bacterium]|nr:GGDEF domain-containing protein [Oscillospiraceae bacterium]
VILSSPWSKLIFYIDPLDNSYHRGAFNLLQLVGGFGFMATSSVIAYVRSRKAHLTDQKKEYIFLCHITFLPFVGGTLQMINFDFIFLWPFTAATVFLIYINFQKTQIAVDALTSLNNRGTLERYLHQRAQERRPNWYLLMADIDDFKSINDRHGHAEGDRALQITAQALVNVFGRSDAFLSRYGGDEFVIIGNFASAEELDAAILQCQEVISGKIRELKLPYGVRVSVGYAQFESREATPVKELLKQADRNMYEQKRSRS